MLSYQCNTQATDLCHTNATKRLKAVRTGSNQLIYMPLSPRAAHPGLGPPGAQCASSGATLTLPHPGNLAPCNGDSTRQTSAATEFRGAGRGTATSLQPRADLLKAPALMMVLLGGVTAKAAHSLTPSPSGGSNSCSSTVLVAGAPGSHPDSVELSSAYRESTPVWQHHQQLLQQQHVAQQRAVAVGTKRSWEQAVLHAQAAPAPAAARVAALQQHQQWQLQQQHQQQQQQRQQQQQLLAAGQCGNSAASTALMAAAVAAPHDQAMLLAARRTLMARRTRLLQLAAYRHQQLAAAAAAAAAPVVPQPAPPQHHLAPAAAAPHVHATVASPRAPNAHATLLSWAGSVLRVTCHDAYLLAQHIWERAGARVDTTLLVSLGASHAPAVSMLVCLWVAAKLEDNRRNVAGASRLAKATHMLPWSITSVELHIMQLLDWRPYDGWRGGSAACGVTEL